METELQNTLVNRSVAPTRFKEATLISIDQATKIATDLLTDIMRFRRIAGGDHASCGTVPCQACLAPHLQKVVTAITERKPLTLVLPAFPGKSPNPSKVLGVLPDMAEQRALEFLNHLCERIQKFHAPGARVILCSDGRVFSDVVGMREEDVSAYQQELSRMIKNLGLSSISTFNLDDCHDGQDFMQMRRELMEQHGKPLDVLRSMVRDGGNRVGGRENTDAHRLYCGITRFLVEDATRPDSTQTRTQMQKECKARAYEVIQRSNAWSELIANLFPDAIRLSIHPQVCGSSKLGIRLVGNENWMTPWHGVAVDVGGRFLLLKRSHAEALGARVVYSAGRASHYELSAPRLSSVSGV